MTDIASALATPIEPLTPFEGVDVLRVGVEVRNAGGGLNQPLQFEPREFGHDEEATIVLRCKVRKVRFDEIKDKNDPDELLGLIRVHVFDAIEAAFIEDDVVAEVLDAQAERIRLAKEAAAGIARLPLDGEDDEATVLERQHRAGVHADGLRADCALCQDEEAAVAAEARGKAKGKG